MEPAPNSPKKKRSVKKTLLWILGIFFVIISIVSFILYNNFNKLLSNALMKSFNSSIISDVYELKFEKLSVNFLAGDVTVYNMEMQPKEENLVNYPYINSLFRLKAAKMSLDNVELMTLIKSEELKLEKIELQEPEVDLRLDGDFYVFFPFGDTSSVESPDKPKKKKAIESFFLKEFALTDAVFHVNNLEKEREFNIQKLNISLKDLLINQPPGKFSISNKSVDFSIGKFTGRLTKRAIKYIDFEDFKIELDSLNVQQSVDTAMFHFSDFNMGLKKLDIQTADSVSHFTMESYDLSYKDKSIKLKNVSFKPNISEAAMQKKYAYQHTQFSGTVGSMEMLGVNFDSLIYKRKIFIDEILLDKVAVSIFKDKTKPFDTNKFPVYLGQQIGGIPITLMVKQLKATDVNLVNRELKPTGDYGKANINRATLTVKNITTLPTDKPLTITADAYIENKAHAIVTLSFDYNQTQFGIEGKLARFNLPDLNPLIKSYTPASIEKGIADEIAFSGTAFRTNASGTMKFLYHDLEIDLALKDQAKWKSSVLSFAANTYLNSSNPGSSSVPPRIVKFQVDRDMNKGFVNILIKSVLNGLKETMIMSKENKKEYKKEKKEMKKKNRKDKKNNKD